MAAETFCWVNVSTFSLNSFAVVSTFLASSVLTALTQWRFARFGSYTNSANLAGTERVTHSGDNGVPGTLFPCWVSYLEAMNNSTSAKIAAGVKDLAAACSGESKKSRRDPLVFNSPQIGPYVLSNEATGRIAC
jgi:hypothetical protein